jgi:hypothetical protein
VLGSIVLVESSMTPLCAPRKNFLLNLSTFDSIVVSVLHKSASDPVSFNRMRTNNKWKATLFRCLISIEVCRTANCSSVNSEIASPLLIVAARCVYWISLARNKVTPAVKKGSRTWLDYLNLINAHLDIVLVCAFSNRIGLGPRKLGIISSLNCCFIRDIQTVMEIYGIFCELKSENYSYRTLN